MVIGNGLHGGGTDWMDGWNPEMGENEDNDKDEDETRTRRGRIPGMSFGLICVIFNKPRKRIMLGKTKKKRGKTEERWRIRRRFFSFSGLAHILVHILLHIHILATCPLPLATCPNPAPTSRFDLPSPTSRLPSPVFFATSRRLEQKITTKPSTVEGFSVLVLPGTFGRKARRGVWLRYF
jgi:hypothetical protein